jgi:hypothetical protein
LGLLLNAGPLGASYIAFAVGKKFGGKTAAAWRGLFHRRTGRTYSFAGCLLSLPLLGFERKPYKKVSRETFFELF